MSEQLPGNPPVKAQLEGDVLVAKGEWVALGSDPFEEEVEADPFIEGLERLGLQPIPAAAPAPAITAVPKAAAPAPARPLVHRRVAATPRLSEVEVPDADGWLDRLIPTEHRRRLSALTHLTEGESAYDRFGLAPDVMKRAFPIVNAIYRAWFRVRSEGVDHVPSEGPAILAANHGGLLPFDGAMLVMDVLLRTDPPRLPRAVVDRWAGSLPWINVFYARVGQVVGTRENFADLLDEGQLLLVFPEGMEGVRKPVNQRYRLQHFHVGFVEQALRAGAPVIPVAVIGSDDQAPILYDFRGLAKRLGLPTLPITPTFPWFGPLGLVPYPVQYRIVYGEPLRFHERFGPEDADDARLVQFLAKQVRREIQRLLDRR